MNRILIALSIVLMLSSVVGCAGLPSIPGVTPPKPQVMTLDVSAVCPNCTKESHTALMITAEDKKPIQYSKVGIADVDTFVESANKLYGTTLVLEKMVEVGQKMKADPSTKVAGFTDHNAVMALAKTMFTNASTDAPKLISSGTSMVTNLPGLVQGNPTMVLALPEATTQVNLSIERLNISQEKLTAMAGSFSE